MWSLFTKDTTYFGPGEPAFMVNYRVDQDENGRFAWVTDPEDHRIELWEPAPSH